MRGLSVGRSNVCREHGGLKSPQDTHVRVKMPVKGLERSKLLALGAIVIYQLALLYQQQRHLPLGQGSKPLLRAA